jgi:hypothetical protein
MQGLTYSINGYFLDGTERSVIDHTYIIRDKLTNKLIDEISE